jgi:hypothetical protein
MENPIHEILVINPEHQPQAFNDKLNGMQKSIYKLFSFLVEINKNIQMDDEQRNVLTKHNFVCGCPEQF